MAIAAMLAATLFYLLGDTVVKLTTTTVPVGQIIAVRGFFATCLVAAAAAATGALWHARKMFTPSVLLRSLLDAATTLLFTSALAHMRIADATAIINAVPISSTLIAIAVLGEKVTALRWGAIIAGFIGVLLVLRPDPAGFDVYGLLAVAAMMMLGIREVVTRRIPVETPSLVVTLCSAIAVTIGGGIAAIVSGDWVALDRSETLNLGIAAVFLFGAYHTSVLSLRYGEVSLVGPFRYAILIWALLVGYIVWGDVPDAIVLAGMALITAAGLAVFHSELRRRP